MADKVHAIGATRQRQSRLGLKFRRQPRHAFSVHIGRVAQNHVVTARRLGKAIGCQQLDSRLQVVPLDVALGHGQGLRRQIQPLYHRLGPGHGGQHRQAAIARAQVHDARRARRQPLVQVTLSQDFGNQAARNDAAGIDMKRHALQPGFPGQVSGGLARFNATRNQCACLGKVLCRELTRFFVQRCVQRQAELPEDQPSRFVGGVEGALAKMHARLRQLLRAVGDQFGQGHGAAAASRCCRFSSTRR